jgi:hypothetical protein
MRWQWQFNPRALWCRAPDAMRGLAFATAAVPRAPAGCRAPRHQCAATEPTTAAPLPAGRRATVQRNGSLPLVKTDGLGSAPLSYTTCWGAPDGLAEQQRGDHPAQQHQVTFVAIRTVLTEEACELSMEPDAGIHEGLVWCENPKLPWFPAHPMI